MIDYRVASRGTMVHAIHMLILYKPCLYTSSIKSLLRSISHSISHLFVTTPTSAKSRASI